jgi:hypothetical protein
MGRASGAEGGFELGLLGLRVRVESADAVLLASATTALADWGGEPVPPGAARLRVRLQVAESGPQLAAGLEVTGTTLKLSGVHAAGWAEGGAGVAECHVAAALGADPGALADEVLEPLLLFLLTRAGRIPLHAAGFLLDGGAVVLAGPGGAGKSSLAGEALRAGLPVLGDDIVFLELAGRLRIRGLPRPLHLPATASSPGGGVGPRWRGGRWKERVAVPAARTALLAERGVLCVLARGGEPGLAPVPAEAAVAEVLASLEAGFDHFRAVLPGALERLAAGGCWRLVPDPDPAVSFALLRAGLAARSP